MLLLINNQGNQRKKLRQLIFIDIRIRQKIYCIIWMVCVLWQWMINSKELRKQTEFGVRFIATELVKTLKRAFLSYLFVIVKQCATPTLASREPPSPGYELYIGNSVAKVGRDVCNVFICEGKVINLMYN